MNGTSVQICTNLRLPATHCDVNYRLQMNESDLTDPFSK